MFRTWKIGAPFGIGLYVHWTFLLLPAWVFFSNLNASGPMGALFGVALILAVFACVVLHELGHALTARHFGIPTRNITLYPIGGVASLERMSDRPWEEFWIAVAGPAVNVAIVALLAVPLAFQGVDVLASLSPNPDVIAGGFQGFLLKVNIWLILFNLIPAFPMDGGRILRAILANFLGLRRATEIAAALALFVAVVFFVVGIYNGSLALPLVALFVFFAGQQELAAVRAGEQRRGQETLEVIPLDAELPGQARRPAQPGFSGFTWDDRSRLWVEWRNGHPVHFVSVE